MPLSARDSLDQLIARLDRLKSKVERNRESGQPVEAIELEISEIVAVFSEARNILDSLAYDAEKVTESGSALSRYTMLANAGGLSVAIAQMSTLGYHGHSAVLLFPLWAFGIGLLGSGMELSVQLALPVSRVKAGYAEIDDYTTLGHNDDGDRVLLSKRDVPVEILWGQVRRERHPGPGQGGHQPP